MRFVTRFSSNFSDAKILRFFAQEKWGSRIQCDWCGSYRVFRHETSRWRCRRRWKTFDIFTGTFLGKFRTSLRFWHEIIWCFALQYSAHKAHRFLVTPKYDSCIRAYQIIRTAISDDSKKQGEKKFKGTIELDESFYGGAFKNLRKQVRQELRRKGLNKRGGGAKFRKQPVFGVFKRNGEVYLEPISGAVAEVLEPIIAKKINVTSKIFSDEGTWYNGLVGLGYIHRTIQHGQQEYVRGEVHINGLEGFWGLSKTNMRVYKGIRQENWVLYLKEMEFRYNNRRLNFDQQVKKIIQLLMVRSRSKTG